MQSGRFDVRELPDQVQATFRSDYYGKQVGVRFKDEPAAEHVALPEFYLGHLDTVKDLKVRDDDIWIVTYPKTGTTFASEMIWLLVNDLDYAHAAREILVRRLTHVE